MRSLIFVQNLKQKLIEIDEISTSLPIYSALDYGFVQEVKAYALSKLQGIKIKQGNDDLYQFSVDLLNRGNLDKRLKYCNILLNELKIPKGERLDLLKQAIEAFIQNKDKHRRRLNYNETATIDELLVLELANCFRPWYYPEDVFQTEFAFERQLINFNASSRTWTTSNIGNYFIKTSAFEAIAFLCALEITLTSEDVGHRFLSQNVLNQLLGEEKNKNNWRRVTRPHTLKLFGLVSEYSKDDDGDDIKLTDFGQRVLKFVKSNLEELKDIILLLMEAETTGFKFKDVTSISEFDSFIDTSTYLDVEIKKQIKNGLQQYTSEKYVEGLRIIFPLLEGILNIGIKSINLNPSDFKGMRGKVEKLEKEGKLSLKVATGLEVFESRNKVLHGNLIENDPETSKPLFDLVLTYLKKVTSDLERNQ